MNTTHSVALVDSASNMTSRGLCVCRLQWEIDCDR